MPVSMLFEYRYVLLFLKQVHEEQITPKINKNEKTRSSAKFLPQRANNCRGERSLLTKGVNLFNSYLMGRRGVGLQDSGSDLRIRLVGALWEGGVKGALGGWGFAGCQSHWGVLSFVQSPL